jgi:hypothetical protein
MNPPSTDPISHSDEDSDEASSSTNVLHRLTPPPENEYASESLCFLEAKKHAGEHGFSLMKPGKSYRNRSGDVYKRLLRCSREGTTPERAIRVRLRRSSKKTRCPMAMYMVAIDVKNPQGPWQLRLQRGQGSFLHNHKGVERRLFADQRRLRVTESQMAIVRSHRRCGIRPQQTLSQLMAEDPDCILTTKDIVNSQRAELLQERAHWTVAEHFIRDAEREVENGAFFRYELSEERRIRSFFFVPNEASGVLVKHPDVLIIDCTYKTNLYNLPMVDMVGATANGTSFQVAIGLVANEDERSFSWILRCFADYAIALGIKPRVILIDRDQALMNALRNVYADVPILLCRWHLNKDFLAYCRVNIAKQVFNEETRRFVEHEDVLRCDELFRKCLYAEDPDAFEASMKDLESSFPTIARYLHRTWWPYKEMLASAWTKKVRHFGYVSTSAVEGWHHSIKAWVGGSRSDIHTLLLKLLALWKPKFSDLLTIDPRKSISTVSYQTSGTFFARVRGIIHRQALDSIAEEIKKREDEKGMKEEKNVRPERRLCSGVFRAVHGYPCTHEIQEMLATDVDLLPTHFDAHWWIDRSQSVAPAPGPAPVLEPEVLRQRRRKAQGKPRHRAGEGVNGTRREKLHAERVDQNRGASLTTKLSTPQMPPPIQHFTPPIAAPIATPGFAPIQPSFPTNVAPPIPPPMVNINIGTMYAPVQGYSPASFPTNVPHSLPLLPPAPFQCPPPNPYEFRARVPPRQYQWVPQTSFETNAAGASRRNPG